MLLTNPFSPANAIPAGAPTAKELKRFLSGVNGVHTVSKWRLLGGDGDGSGGDRGSSNGD